VTKRRELEDREVVRRAFLRAAGDVDPDVSRVRAAVPEMIAEARRRRTIAARAGAISAVVPLARRAIPALAAAAAVLVLVATFVGFRDVTGTVNGTTELDRLILTGKVSGNVSDVVLDAVTGRASDDE